jgi:molybdenum cofactor cytidylyltransferase
MARQAFRVACVVPGAGAGSRFGEPKAAAEVSPGVRFVDSVAATALAAGASPVVVVLPPDTINPTGTELVVNRDAMGEQISSVRLGLTRLVSTDAAGFLLWPVDHPFVTVESVLAVIDGAKRSGASIVLPLHEGRRGHPAWFARDLWRELVTVEEGGARAIVHRHAQHVLEVAVPDPGVVRDIDTRSDLQSSSNIPGD